MCCICVKPEGCSFDKSLMKTAAENNNHGFGMMWIEDGRIRTKKSMGTPEEVSTIWAEQEAKGGLLIGHVRIATHGEKNLDNCHPFDMTSIDKGDKYDYCLMHNGVFSSVPQWKKEMSDTWHFAQYLSEILKNSPDIMDTDEFPELIGCLVGGSKVVILRNDGKYWIINEQAGELYNVTKAERDAKGFDRNKAVWLSNPSSVRPKSTYTSSSSAYGSSGSSSSGTAETVGGVGVGGYEHDSRNDKDKEYIFSRYVSATGCYHIIHRSFSKTATGWVERTIGTADSWQTTPELKGWIEAYRAYNRIDAVPIKRLKQHYGKWVTDGAGFKYERNMQLVEKALGRPFRRLHKRNQAPKATDSFNQEWLDGPIFPKNRIPAVTQVNYSVFRVGKSVDSPIPSDDKESHSQNRALALISSPTTLHDSRTTRIPEWQRHQEDWERNSSFLGARGRRARALEVIDGEYAAPRQRHEAVNVQRMEEADYKTTVTTDVLRECDLQEIRDLLASEPDEMALWLLSQKFNSDMTYKEMLQVIDSDPHNVAKWIIHHVRKS